MKVNLCGLAVWLTAVFAGLAQAAPMIRISEPVWNVGVVIAGKTYDKTITIENAGDKPLVVSKVEECCGFTATLPPGLKLAPGEKAELTLTLAPFKLTGTLQAEMFVHSNDPVRPKASVAVNGEVVPSQNVLGELTQREVSLGRIGMRDRVPFKVRVRSAGTLPLEIRQIDKPNTIIERGTRPVIPPGGEGELNFEYVPSHSGPIDDQLFIVTNDTLERSLEVRLQGEVAEECSAERSISIYPPGGNVAYDVTSKSYRFDFTVNNRGPVQIEVPMIDSSIQGVQIEGVRIIPPGQSAKGSVTYPGGTSAAPNSGWIYLQLAIPVELR